MLSSLERHPHARAVLGAALPPDGNPSHAYLFHGPAGSGKAAAARAFAAELLADGARDPDNARVRVEHGVHPDLTWVAPASAAGILVGDVDEPVVAAATRTPFEASRRVFVIEDADELNDQAANRMLKTLEEPASYVHLVLLTARPGDVLPTIASRCQAVRFDAPGTDELAERLGRQGVAPEQAQACARLALGDANRAIALALGEGPALRAGSEAFARSAVSGDLLARPWLEVLAQARARGERAQAQVEAAGADELELVPKKERRRIERETGRAGQARPPPGADRRARRGARARGPVVPRSRVRRGRRAGARRPQRPGRRTARRRRRAQRTSPAGGAGARRRRALGLRAQPVGGASARGAGDPARANAGLGSP